VINKKTEKVEEKIEEKKTSKKYCFHCGSDSHFKPDKCPAKLKGEA
jgi:hypothetical protein